MTHAQEKYIENVIDHFVKEFKFDLMPYHKAYRIWFDLGSYKNIIQDFLQRMDLRTKIRVTRKNIRTNDNPDTGGYIMINKSALPLFFNNKFREHRFEIFIDTTAYTSFESYICVLIHELAHLTLYSKHNKYCRSEIATDLFVMCFGLYDQFHYMRSRTLDLPGYITSAEIEYARNYILKKQIELKTPPKKHVFSAFFEKIFG